MPIIMTQNGQKYYLHYDQVGTLKAISNSNQRVIKKITYDSYGNILNETNQAFNVPFGFAGGLYDSDTKLTRFGDRDYDAYSGKWTAKDPIDFGGGDSNLYGYVLQDPVNFVDPSGLNAIGDWFRSLFDLGYDEEVLRTHFCNGGKERALYYCATITSDYAQVECKTYTARLDQGLDDAGCNKSCSTNSGIRF